MDFEYYSRKIMDAILAYGPKLILALATFIIGRWLIRRLVVVMDHSMERANFDESLRPFLRSLLFMILFTLLVISVASMVGIATTSFVAVLGAAGLAIGLALQGSLANFAGGVLILFFKPFKVGDLVDIQGHIGHVQQILIFNTTLISPDSKTVVIPNAAISNGNIINLSRQGHLRVDLTIGIGYGEDIKKARDVLMQAMQNHEKVLSDPAPSVNVSELADSSVNLAVRPYAKVEDYWPVYFGVLEAGKIALDEHNINIPFPQRDVHLIKDA